MNFKMDICKSIKVKFIIACLLGFIFSTGNASAQRWMANVKQPQLKATRMSHRFYVEQQAFTDYWKTHKSVNLRGQKQFRRWEYFMEPRLKGDADIRSDFLWKAILAKQNAPSNASSNWSFIGPLTTPLISETTNKSGNGRLNCVAFNPLNSNCIYVGAPAGGIWKTTDGGQSWNTTTDMLDAIGISDIAISPNDTSIIYATTGDGDGRDTYSIGIIKSSNAGKTWEQTAVGFVQANIIVFNRLIMHPESSDTMLASSNNGIFRTTDGWATYTQILSGNHYKDLEFQPGNPSVVFATLYNTQGNAKILRSTDMGSSFSELSSGLALGGAQRIELAVTPADPDYIYALASDTVSDGLHSFHRSTDGGNNWTLVKDKSGKNLLGWKFNGSDNEGQGFYDLALAVSPTNKDLIFSGGVNIWKSADGGNNWDVSTMWYAGSSVPYVHADHHMLKYSPVNNRLYSVNDGGIYFTEDEGNNWNDVSTDLQILQSYKFGVSKLTEYRMITGNQDNGTFLFNGSNWFEVLGGDGMQCHIDPENDNILYGAIYFGEIYKSIDGGLNFSNIMPDPKLIGSWVSPFSISPSSPSTLFVGYNDVYKSTDRGENWTKISENLSPENSLDQLAIAPSNPKYIYTSSEEKLYKTSDGGKNWEELSNFPSRFISSICVSPNDPNELWITFSGYGANTKVYHSANGGSNWENYSTGLPNVPMNKLVFRKNSNKELFLASDIGVYYINVDSTEWTDFSTNLPNVVVTDLFISEKFGKLRAATFGRGIWETELAAPIPPRAAFSSNITEACINAPITLAFEGVYEFDSLNWDIPEGSITYLSPLKDTAVINFSTTGNKTVALNYYEDGNLSRENKSSFIKVLNGDLGIFEKEETYSLCSVNDTIERELVPAYSYQITPNENIVELSDTLLRINPKISTKYLLTGSHGTCESNTSFNFKLMPDMACNALFLNEGRHGKFTNSCASREEGEATPPVGSNDCVSTDGWCFDEDTIRHSLWFKLLAPSTNYLQIKTEGIDTKIALYKAEYCSQLTSTGYELIAANDDISEETESTSEDFNSQLILKDNLTTGDTLYLQVDGSYGGEKGEFEIIIASKPISSLEQKKKISNIKLFPNPTNNSFTLRFILPTASKVDVDIISPTGKLVYSKKGHQKLNFYEEVFNVSHLKGWHLVRIVLNDQVMYRKIIVD